MKNFSLTFTKTCFNVFFFLIKKNIKRGMQIIHSCSTQNVPFKMYKGIEYGLLLNTGIYLEWFSMLLSGGMVVGDNPLRILPSPTVEKEILWKRKNLLPMRSAGNLYFARSFGAEHCRSRLPSGGRRQDLQAKFKWQAWDWQRQITPNLSAWAWGESTNGHPHTVSFIHVHKLDYKSD